MINGNIFINYITTIVDYINNTYDIYLDIFNEYFEMCLDNHIV